MSRLQRIYYLVPVVALVIPFMANEYLLWVVNAMLVYILVTLGFNLVIGNLASSPLQIPHFSGLAPIRRPY